MSFQQAAASDEKTDLVARFLAHLGDELLRDPDWQAADDHQLFLAREIIEQMVMAKVCTLFPPLHDVHQSLLFVLRTLYCS